MLQKPPEAPSGGVAAAADGAPKVAGAEGGHGDLDDEEEFEMGAEGEEVDDEATLEEEEV